MKVVLCPVFWENNVKKIVLNQVQAADCRQAKPIERTKAEKQTGRTSTEKRRRGTGAGERLMCGRKTGEQATFF